MPPNSINYSALNRDHNWEDLCIQILRNRQTSTYVDHNPKRGGPIFAEVS